MSKLLNSTLEKVSENNNDYRKDLRALNNQIDERTTALIGEVVTLSNYTLDFTNAINISKENLVNPILRVIESYAIKDLRSVEEINEKFIEKINDKIENTEINSDSAKEQFISTIDSLLNSKYLEIININRVTFIDENGNSDIERILNDFVSYLLANGKYDELSLNSLMNTYRNDIYSMISKTLSGINKLYQDNFIGEVKSDLRVALKDEDILANSEDEFKPYIPDINPIPTINIPEVPKFDKTPILNNVEPVFDSSKFNEYSGETKEEEPIAVEEEKPKEEKQYTYQKPYDVEEILKIAKSPIVSNENAYVKPEVKEEKQEETVEIEYNERELVEEMIRRFTKRLELIDERQEKYDQDNESVSHDEAFVNDLIDSAKKKKEELDSFEKELDEKERELNEKEIDLEKKINNVLPFAKAVMENDKES